MKCRDVTDLVTEYLEGRMSLADRVRFRLHIAVCPACKRYMRQMEMTVETLGELPPLDIPDDVHGELMKHFQGWKTNDRA